MSIYNYYNKPEELDFPCDNPDKAFGFVEEILPWGYKLKSAEKIISKDALQSLKYAMYIIKDDDKRFPDGEDAIATNLKATWKYVMLIQQRFPKGEKIIATDRKFADQYNQMFGTNL